MKTKVLIVDDNEDIVYMIRYILEKNAFTVFSATNGTDGIALAIAKTPKLILLDIQLTDLDGYKVCKILRETEKTKNAIIITMTAGQISEELTLNSGANGQLEKPIDPYFLLNYIKNIGKVN